MRTRGRRFAAAIPLLAALAVPASASAEATVAEAAGGALHITGQPGLPSMVEVRYRTAAEAGFGGLSDRLVVEDVGGVQPLGADCAAINPTAVSCDARQVRSIRATLGDGDDVMVINAGKGDGVPRRLATDLRGQGGADVIRGGLAADRLLGQQGRDTLAGWKGNDFLSGGSGSDGLIGFGGDDTLLGGSGRDALFGQKGHDSMFGGAQNDVLLARDGFRDPKLNCGPGSRQRAITDRRDPRTVNCRSPEPKSKR